MIKRHRDKVHLTLDELHKALGLPAHLEVLGMEQDSMKGGVRITVDGDGMPDYYGHSSMTEITLAECRALEPELHYEDQFVDD